MTRSQQYDTVRDETRSLFLAKNKDYGDAFARLGPVGVIVRLEDKLHRFINVSQTQISMVQGEGVRDTLLDMINYATMAVMLMDETQPPHPPTTGEEE